MTDFLDEDDDLWEDHEAYSYILSTVPDGWRLVKVMAGWSVLAEMREWIKDNLHHRYEEVNWADGGCSYSVGVMFENNMDAILFKLRWG